MVLAMAVSTIKQTLSWSSNNPVLLVATVVCLYVASIAVYRLYLSPLAGIPGPKIAALTSLYPLYHDLIRGGQYIWVIQEMHKQYGPIVRIRPEVIHISDPLFIENIYSGTGKRRDKYKTTTNQALAPGAVIATTDHELHRRRRATLSHFFSKQSVRRFEPILQESLRKLLRRMEDWAVTGSPAPMNLAFKAATKDVISNYAFGEDSSGSLDRDDLDEAYFQSIPQGPGVFFPLYFHWLAEIMMTNLPPSVTLFLFPPLADFIKFREGLSRKIAKIKASSDHHTNTKRSTIIHNILNSKIPDSEKEVSRVTEEAFIILIAGTDTTAGTMAVICYLLLTNPKILKNVKTELSAVIPSAQELPSCADLNSLPYLTAVVNEAMRLFPATTMRQDRVAPDEPLLYQAPNGDTHSIPAGTPVGMTAYLVNRSEIVYSDPQEFRPERYLEDPKLTKYLLSFSKGTRQCLGINLAYEEMLLFLAGIFHKYDRYDGTGTQKGPTLELYKTTRDDIEYVADFVSPGLKPGSKGVRLIVRNGQHLG